MKKLLMILLAVAAVIVMTGAGCSAFKDLTKATTDKAVALGSDTWGGGAEAKVADAENPVPYFEGWFGRRKVWYVSGKDAAVLNATANVVRASNSPISASVGASGIGVGQEAPAAATPPATDTGTAAK